MRLSGISDNPGKNRVDGKGSATVQATHTGNHQPQPRCLHLLHAAGATALRGRLAQLLRSESSLSSDSRTGPMAAAACTDVLLETVETCTHPAATTHPAGHPSGGGVQSHPQSSGLLVYGRDKYCAARAGQWLAGGTGSAKSQAAMGRDALRQGEPQVQPLCR